MDWSFSFEKAYEKLDVVILYTSSNTNLQGCFWLGSELFYEQANFTFLKERMNEQISQELRK